MGLPAMNATRPPLKLACSANTKLQAKDHKGHLLAEIADIFEPLAELQKIFFAVTEEGKNVGANEAAKYQLEILYVELIDLQRKFLKSGFCQQFQLTQQKSPYSVTAEAKALENLHVNEEGANITISATTMKLGATYLSRDGLHYVKCISPIDSFAADRVALVGAITIEHSEFPALYLNGANCSGAFNLDPVCEITEEQIDEIRIELEGDYLKTTAIKREEGIYATI